MDDEKPIRWVSTAYEDLLAFPKDARKEAGLVTGRQDKAIAAARYRAVVNSRKEKK